MIPANSRSTPDAGHDSAALTPLKVPRTDSLWHHLQRARDGEGKPLPLLDELFLHLDDPPAGTGDRWQKGADFCGEHGIKTSRMSVWRLYRAHILAWRREQNPAPLAPAPSVEETSRLRDHSRHLAAQRVHDALNDPGLSPGHLIGFLQNDNHRQQIELAREQFADRLAVRRRLEQQKKFQRIDDEARGQQLLPAQMKHLRNVLATLLAVPPNNGTSPSPPTAA